MEKIELINKILTLKLYLEQQCDDDNAWLEFEIACDELKEKYNLLYSDIA